MKAKFDQWKLEIEIVITTTTKRTHNVCLIVHKYLIGFFFISFSCPFRQLFTLWSWLPARITMYTPTLLYTTEEHGCSLTTFYVRVEQHEPTLLMIKTCNNEVSR